MGIEGVVFDLGNVLIDWQPEPAIAAGVGADQARDFLARFAFREWNHQQDAGRPFAESEAEAIAAHPEWRDHILSYRANFPLSLVREITGTVEIVRDLHSRGVPLYALTNWAAETFHHAEQRYPWLDLFELVVVSGREQLAKPDRRIFEILVEKSGHRADTLLFVDDSEVNVRGARAAGLQAVLFTDPAALHDDLVAAGVL